MRLKGSLVGPLVTVAVLAAFVILDATMVRIQNPAPIFLIAVTFSGYVGGVAPALASAALAIAFSLYYFSAPGQLLVYTPADQARLASIVLGTVAIAAMTGLLRERLLRAERGAATERERRAETAAADIERQRLRAILDQLPEGVSISDEHGRFTFWNQTAEALFSWPDRELDTVLAGAQFLRPDGTPYLPDELPGARARAGEVVRGEELVVRVRATGRDVPLLMSSTALRSSDGALIGTVSVFQDITARRELERARAEEQRRSVESERRLRASLDVSLDAHVAMDSAGRITDWNPSAEAMFGQSRAAVLGQEMADVIIPERYRAPHRDGLRHYLATGQGRVIGRRIEIEALRHDGTEFPIELAIAAVELDGGPAFTAFVRDISARKRSEAAQAAAIVQVQSALKVRDEFLSAAAHDLKTPLTTMKGHLQLVRKRLGADASEAVRTSLDHGERAAARMAGLVAELLDVAHLQSGKGLDLDRRDTDLVAIARNIADALNDPAARHIIRVDAPTGPVVGRWDAARIERVVGNVLSNSIKYSPAGGPIEMTVQAETGGADGWAVLTVVDHGIGIPATDLERLFGRFERGSNVHGIDGTGLGLAGAQRLVELHGGRIDLESREGEGTTVTIRLPLGTR